MHSRAALITRLRLRRASDRGSRSDRGSGSWTGITLVISLLLEPEFRFRYYVEPEFRFRLYVTSGQKARKEPMTDRITAQDRRWIALILLCVAQFVVVLDASTSRCPPSARRSSSARATSRGWSTR